MLTMSPLLTMIPTTRPTSNEHTGDTAGINTRILF
ncbi:MAG: hypothetical protein A07HN63_02355 [uncultured archaeon A07HN63]|nr:MAG: hypothetical protein A07HN63_02355 [uncultured archaeon A07HN63]